MSNAPIADPSPAAPGTLTFSVIAALLLILLTLTGSLAAMRTPPTAAGDAQATGLLIDVNHADAAALRLLPGIGAELAHRVVEHRQERRFTSLDNLVEVRGIGALTLQRLRPFAICGPALAAAPERQLSQQSSAQLNPPVAE